MTRMTQTTNEDLLDHLDLAISFNKLSNDELVNQIADLNKIYRDFSMRLEIANFVLGQRLSSTPLTEEILRDRFNRMASRDDA